MTGLNRRTFLRNGLTGIGALPFALSANQPSAQMSGHYGGTASTDFITTRPQDFIHPTLASNATDDVGVRLICMFDSSGSIDITEYFVQLQAMSNAIASQDFQDAVFLPSGPQSIAICFADFGSNVDIRIPWVDIRQGEQAKLKLIAQEVSSLTRRESGSTHQVQALLYSMMCLDFCPWQSDKTIIDLMTDGKDNQAQIQAESLLQNARDRIARQYGATINVLTTIDPFSDEADLVEWVQANIATQPNTRSSNGNFVDPGFVKVVAFEDTEESNRSIVRYEKAMERAFKEKLIKEVAGLSLDELDAQRSWLRKSAPRPEPSLIPANINTRRAP